MANSTITKNKIVNGWSYLLSLTSDKSFTAQRDMFVNINFNPSTISGGAALVKIDDDCLIGLNALTGIRATQCVPLKAGETISVVSVSNGSLSIQYSYMWGGT